MASRQSNNHEGKEFRIVVKTPREAPPRIRFPFYSRLSRTTTGDFSRVIRRACYKIYRNPRLSISVTSCIPASMASFSCSSAGRITLLSSLSLFLFTLHIYKKSISTIASLITYPISILTTHQLVLERRLQISLCVHSRDVGRLVSWLLAILERLWSDDIPNAVPGEKSGASQLFLRVTGYVGADNGEGHAEAETLEVT
jgi:hypothetical protein